MVLSIRHLSMIVALLVAITALRVAEEPCGIAVSNRLLYEAPSADLFYPDPRVISVSGSLDNPEIRISFDVEGQKEFRQSIIRTSDWGETWRREGTQTHRFQEFSGPSVRYRVSLDGRALQRSLDDGKHWKQTRLQMEGEGAQSAANSLRWRFELAAIHPAQRETIYGCFRPLGESTGEARKGSAGRYSGIFVSNDGGDHWSPFFRELNHRTFDESCLLGISPWNPELMFVHGEKGLLVSRNGGRNWDMVGDSEVLEKPAELMGYDEALAAHKRKGLPVGREWPFDWTYLAVTQIEFVPGHPDTVFLVTNKGIYRTMDGARSWRLLDTGIPRVLGAGNLYSDPTRNGRIFVGTDVKVLVSEDLGCHFRTFFDWKSYVSTLSGTPREQGRTLLHELGHATGVLLDDRPGHEKNQQVNEDLLKKNCGKTINSFRNSY